MDVLFDYLPGFVLTLARVTAMVASMLMLGTTDESKWSRLVLALGLSGVLFLRAPTVIVVGPSLISFGVMVGREVVLGLAIGFSIQIILMVMRSAGAVLGHEMGFSMAQVVDPNTGFSTPVVGRFFETLSMLLLLAVDGHHEAFRILSDTFDRLPVGRSFDVQRLAMGLSRVIGDGLELAISLASPVYAVMLLLTVVMVVLARAVPQIHLMEFGYAVRILLALVAMAIFMSGAAPYVFRMFRQMFAGVRDTLNSISEMGIFDDKDDKTEAATPKKKTDARQKGQVAQSQELSMAMLLVAAIIALEITGPWILGSLSATLHRGLAAGAQTSTGITWGVEEIRTVAAIIAPSLLPLLACLVLFGLTVGFSQVGFLISWEKMTPKFDKLNPASGMKRIFSLRGAVKAGLALLKLGLLGGVLWWNLSEDLPLLMQLPELPFLESAPLIGNLLLEILWWIAIPLFGLSLLDLIYQRWQHARDLKMSKMEVKDEQKQVEGDPEVKSRIKRAQREIARRRMMAEVPKADVVITNPTHWAIALKYERAEMSAPVVTAKGTDQVALRIRRVARENGVPVMEDPPLARALCRGVRLGDEIPPRFYKAVATVLSHVMRMRKEAV